MEPHPKRPPKEKCVFVVHGRDLGIRHDMYEFLNAVHLVALDWEHDVIARLGKGAPFIGEILDEAFDSAQAIVVLLTGDDEARLRRPFLRNDDPPFEGDLTPSPRPNVLFEAGMAFAKNPTRTILVRFGTVRPFSDIAGRHVLNFDGSSSARFALIQRLRNAGCDLYVRPDDCPLVGDFTPNVTAEPDLTAAPVFFDSVNASNFVSDLEQLIKQSSELVFIGTGLTALTGPIRELIVDRARHRELSAYICFGNPAAPDVKNRLTEEERCAGRPDVAADGIMHRAHALLKEAAGVDGVVVKFFQNYPTMSIFKFVNQRGVKTYYVYPFGYRRLGNLCPVMRFQDPHVYSRFLDDAIRLYREDAVDAAEVLRIAAGDTGTAFLKPANIVECAVYVVPDARSSFYRAGSALLGSDLLGSGVLDTIADDEDTIFFRECTNDARRYGFHMTVLDLMYIESPALDVIRNEVAEAARRLPALHLRPESLEQDVLLDGHLMIRCTESTGSLELLHHELAQRVLPLALGTNYSLVPEVRELWRMTDRDYLVMGRYRTPFVMGRYVPHFTLASHLQHLPADRRQRLTAIAASRFGALFGTTLRVPHICFLSRPFSPPGGNWHVEQIPFRNG